MALCQYAYGMEKDSRAPTTRDSDKYVVRLPEGMRDRIAAAAKINNRTMNAEIIARLQDSFKPSVQALNTNDTLAALVNGMLEIRSAVLSQKDVIDQLKANGQYIKIDSSGKVTGVDPTNEEREKYGDFSKPKIRGDFSYPFQKDPERPVPKNKWFDRGFVYSILSTETNGRIRQVARLVITGDAPREGDGKLIYDEIEAVHTLHGSDCTVWLDVQGDVIPKSVHTAVKHLVSFGVGLVVTLNGKSTLSSPESFPKDFMVDLYAAARGGLVWCPFKQELMHQPHGFRGSAKYAAKADANETSSDSVASKQVR